ncbi:hypothetical protein YC2023_071322 [Brassica napus]
MLDSGLLWVSNLKSIGYEWIDPNPLYSIRLILIFPTWDVSININQTHLQLFGQQAQSSGIPQLRKLESLGLYVNRRVGDASRRSNNGIGSNDAALLLSAGILVICSKPNKRSLLVSNRVSYENWMTVYNGDF